MTEPMVAINDAPLTAAVRDTFLVLPMASVAIAFTIYLLRNKASG